MLLAGWVSPWNSLEVAKLCVSLLTPLAVVTLGIYIHRVTKKFEHRQWFNQKLVEKRLDTYDQMAPLLNEVLCYFTFVGSWKELDPPQVVRLKRELDKKIYLAAPLFPPSFFDACMAFQHECFSMFNAWGQDAKLRTPNIRRKQHHPRSWDATWDDCFHQEHVDPKHVQFLHSNIMREFAKSFRDRDFEMPKTSTRIPSNII